MLGLIAQHFKERRVLRKKIIMIKLIGASQRKIKRHFLTLSYVTINSILALLKYSRKTIINGMKISFVMSLRKAQQRKGCSPSVVPPTTDNCRAGRQFIKFFLWWKEGRGFHHHGEFQ